MTAHTSAGSVARTSSTKSRQTRPPAAALPELPGPGPAGAVTSSPRVAAPLGSGACSGASAWTSVPEQAQRLA